MNLSLHRIAFREDGIISSLDDENGKCIAMTLEHSYDCKPKIPDGKYLCVRSMHRLHGMTQDFETFMITGVAGHTDLLFHWGNYNEDSDGCVLTGNKCVMSDRLMVTDSRETFAKFMAIQQGVDSFSLTVTS